MKKRQQHRPSEEWKRGEFIMGFHLPTQTRERLERSTRLEDDRRRDPSGVVVSMPTGIDRARRIERVRRWIIVQLSSEGKPAVARGEAEAQSGE